MTREEAIEYLNTLYMAFAVFPNQQISLGDVDKMKESVNMAINALEQEPSGDLISRQVVKEQMIEYGFRAPDMTVTEFVEDLLPSAKQERTGHWTTIEMTQDDGCRYTVTYCSECDEDVDYRTDYCPNCGAKMVEQKSEGV